MLIATNRSLNHDKVTDGKGNGESFGEVRGEELCLAVATEPERSWRVELLDQEAFLEATRAGSKNFVLYIHGFNKPFVETLVQATQIEHIYDVDVILFSWPSLARNAVGQVDAYLEARAVAEASSAEFHAFLQLCAKVGSSPGEQQRSVTLLAHSEGNYLLQKYLESNAFDDRGARGFTNVVLSQADVDSEGHYRWLCRLEAERTAVYVTINQSDEKLEEAEKGLKLKRLGKTWPPDVQGRVTYVNFTPGEGVNGLHNLWRDAVSNTAVKEFFAAVLNGKRFPDLVDARWHCNLLTLDPG